MSMGSALKGEKVASGGFRSSSRRRSPGAVRSAISFGTGLASAEAASTNALTSSRIDRSSSRGIVTLPLFEHLQVEQHLSERQVVDLLRCPPELLRQHESRLRQRGVDRPG